LKVQDLARELGKHTKEFIKFLAEFDIRVKSGSTRLDDETIEQIREIFKGETPHEKNAAPNKVTIPDTSISVSDFAALLKRPVTEVLKVTLGKGLLLNLNSEIDAATAQEIGLELDIDIQLQEAKTDVIREQLYKIEEDEIDQDTDNLVTRPPVITVMGHVDHGKTALLDAIRKSNVVAGEAGGITQHIGAYQVKVQGKPITFLDTPGHAAFTALRARGAQVTDIVILVVAADEGIKPQTVEAINHAKASGVPIIVAANKIDKPDANIDNVKKALTEHELVPEDWGGKTVVMGVSAKSRDGLDELLEMILLTAEMQDLQASEVGPAKAVIIESHLSRKKGALATVLVKTGTLKVGDHFVIDGAYGKVKALHNDKGEIVESVPPGTPAELLGVTDVPSPGSILEVQVTEKGAKSIASENALELKSLQNKHAKSVSLEQLSNQAKSGKNRALNLIIKGDVNGSLDAIAYAISQIKIEDVAVNIVHSATGPVSENDIMLGVASQALVVAFNVSVSNEAQRIADNEDITVRHYTIIYEIIEDIEKSLSGLFEPEFEEVEFGRAEVRQIFKFSKVGIICGSSVQSGTMRRNAIAKVFRGNDEIYYGKIDSLKRFKEDVKEVNSGFECGIVLEKFNDVEEGDIVINYEVREKNT
jgi:translation initiation factor IF-2